MVGGGKSARYAGRMEVCCLRGEKGKECICIDSQSEWTGAFIDGQNVGRVERSLRSEVKKEELEVKVDGKGLHIVT